MLTLRKRAKMGGLAFAKRLRTDVVFRRRISKSRMGNKNPSRKPASRIAISRGQKRAWKDPRIRARRLAGIQKAWDKNWESRVEKVFTEEYGQKMSRRMKGRDPVGRPRGPRKVWYVGNGTRISMRSGSEVQYAKMLDRAGIQWLYECCTFVVDKRTWTPDFYLPEKKLFVEVKGWLLGWVKRKIEKVIKHFHSTKFLLMPSDKLTVFD
jgi:hypothetical protein